LEKDLAMTKQQHATELNQMKAEIKKLQDEVESLKKHRSSTPPHNDDESVYFSEDLENSPKQGRIRTEAEFKGRKLNFEQDFADLDDVVNVQEKEDAAVGSKEIFPKAVETHKVTVETVTDVMDVADAEFQRKRVEKGKVQVVDESSEQSKKISKKEQAQIDYDAELAKELAEAEIEKKKKLRGWTNWKQ
jgi:hypothetical protein